VTHTCKLTIESLIRTAHDVNADGLKHIKLCRVDRESDIERESFGAELYDWIRLLRTRNLNHYAPTFAFQLPLVWWPNSHSHANVVARTTPSC
jgi:hypothetical protein